VISRRRRNGIAAGTAYPEIPGAEYGLTTLLDVMLSLIDWAGAHHDRIRGNQGHCRADKSWPFRWQTAKRAADVNHRDSVTPSHQAGCEA
jgi:hypothetical protein